MRRSGMTLIEVLVIVAILAILVALCFAAGGGCQSYSKDTQKTGTYVCVKTYTVASGESSTSKRVDLRPIEGGNAVTFECDDSWRADVYNSATLYAQFEAGKTYTVTTVGRRREGHFALFPLVTSVSELKLPDPKK